MKNIFTVGEYACRFLAFLVDGVFPPSPIERRVRAMEPAELSALTRVQSVPPCGATVLFSYGDETIKHLIWLLKYRRNAHAAALFAAVLHDALAEMLGDERLFGNDAAPLLIPVPLSKKRRRARGYNQTELLATALVAHAGKEWYDYQPNILIKMKETLPQTSLPDKMQRSRNLRGAFGAAGMPMGRGPSAPSIKTLLTARTVILLDDVTTTGATFSEARRALRRAGATRIIPVAIAH